jgi:hypothetical protein
LFLISPKFPGAVIVANGTFDHQENLKEWKPESEFFCKRKGSWLETVGAEAGKKFDGMS